MKNRTAPKAQKLAGHAAGGPKRRPETFRSLKTLAVPASEALVAGRTGDLRPKTRQTPPKACPRGAGRAKEDRPERRRDAKRWSDNRRSTPEPPAAAGRLECAGWNLNGLAGQAPKAQNLAGRAARGAGMAAEAQNACRASPGLTGDPRSTKPAGDAADPPNACPSAPQLPK